MPPQFVPTPNTLTLPSLPHEDTHEGNKEEGPWKAMEKDVGFTKASLNANETTQGLLPLPQPLQPQPLPDQLQPQYQQQSSDDLTKAKGNNDEIKEEDEEEEGRRSTDSPKVIMRKEDMEKLVDMLRGLELKKSAIKVVGDWLRRRDGSAREVAEALREFVTGRGFKQKLSVVYLINDITSLNEQYRKALEETIGEIIESTIQSACEGPEEAEGAAEESLKKVGDVLTLWERCKVFGATTTATMVSMLKRQQDAYLKKAPSRLMPALAQPDPESEPDKKKRRKNTQ